MKKCKIFPISFVSEDSLRRGNDYYEGVIKDNRIYFMFLDYGDAESLCPTNREGLSDGWATYNGEFKKYVASFTDLQEAKDLVVKDRYWPKHESSPDRFQIWQRGFTSDSQQIENREKAVEAFIPYESGLVRFEVEGKFGFADRETGEIRIKPTWDYADDFYRGVARVVSGCTLWYCRDYYGISFKSEGGKTEYINTENHRIEPSEMDIIKAEPESNITYEQKTIKDYWGETTDLNDVPKSYILYEKMMIYGALEMPDGIECNYRLHQSGPCWKGVIHNNKVYDFNPKTGCLDLVEVSIGEAPIERRKEDISLNPYSDKLVQMEVNGKWGCFSLYSGRIVIEPSWDYMDEFNGAYTRVICEADNIIRMDRESKLPLTEGKHGVIDRYNNIVIPPVYDKLIFFDQQYFMVIKNGKKGLLTSKNEVIIPIIYEELRAIRINFEDLLFVVSRDNKKGVINRQNEVVIPLIYDEIKNIRYDTDDPFKSLQYFKVSKDNKKGLINLQNKAMIPIQWDELYAYDDYGQNDMRSDEVSFPGDDFDDYFANYFGDCVGKLSFYMVGQDETISSPLGGNELSSDSNTKKDDSSTNADVSEVNRRKYGIYDRDFKLIIPVELDRRPVFCRTLKFQVREEFPNQLEPGHPNMVLKKAGKFGFLSSTGVIMSEPILSKKDAVKIIKEKWQRESDEYLRNVLNEMKEDYLGCPEADSPFFENTYGWMKHYSPQLIEVFEERNEPELKSLASEMEMELNKLNITKVKALFVQMQQLLEVRF